MKLERKIKIHRGIRVVVLLLLSVVFTCDAASGWTIPRHWLWGIIILQMVLYDEVTVIVKRILDRTTEMLKNAQNGIFTPPDED